ncbi:hypothetical protein GQX74_001967 [Glossina fuscipes]|nr:hypothetical protein GQX74_001967 [Glossina fuscipes]
MNNNDLPLAPLPPLTRFLATLGNAMFMLILLMIQSTKREYIVEDTASRASRASSDLFPLYTNEQYEYVHVGSGDAHLLQHIHIEDGSAHLTRFTKTSMAWTTSGAIQHGEPMQVPRLPKVESTSRDKPKSHNLIRPSLVTRILSPRISRCKI